MFPRGEVTGSKVDTARRSRSVWSSSVPPSILAAAQPAGVEARRALKTGRSSLPAAEHGSLWRPQHASTGQLSASHSGRQTQTFFFFTILFITISVLFSCKGIQQKLLKRSCPQNGAARLPFLGMPHVLLLVPREGEPGGTVYQRVSSPGSHRGGTGEGLGLSGRGAERGHLRGAPGVGAGAWDGLPQERNSILPFLPQPGPNLPRQGQRRAHPPQGPRISPQGTAGLGAGAREEPRQSVWYGEGHAAPPALPAGVCFWWEGGRRGSLIPVIPRSPLPDPPLPEGSMGGGRC